MDNHITTIIETLEQCLKRYFECLYRVKDIPLSLKEMTDRSRYLTNELALLDDPNYPFPDPQRRRLISREIDEISEIKREMELELNESKMKLKEEYYLIKDIKENVRGQNIEDETLTEYLSILENQLKDAKNYIKNSS